MMMMIIKIITIIIVEGSGREVTIPAAYSGIPEECYPG
jgi:hypothetical protein